MTYRNITVIEINKVLLSKYFFSTMLFIGIFFTYMLVLLHPLRNLFIH